MQGIFEILFYLFSFFSLYVQIYFLVVFLENYKDLKIRRSPIRLFKEDEEYPGVTITVPAYNEGENVAKTVESLLKLNYPKNKLSIILVDDGSRDEGKTWAVMKRYENHPQIRIFTKPNGGKYTAQNLGLEHTTTPFLGCLDSDSEVDPEALNRIISYFSDNTVMAVAPTIVSKKEANIVQKAQKIDYELQIYVKKMYAFVDAIHVTPGPFSIFRREVFEKIGPYKHAHMTEDQEIAMRMHHNNMRIEHAPDAYIYTNTPKTVKALYKQRTRWIYGFIRNSLDYRHMFFRKRYGNIGFITIPSGFISVLSVIFLLSFALYNLIRYLHTKSLVLSAVGVSFDAPKFNFDPFFINTSAILFISIFVYATVFFSLFMGHRILHGKAKFNFNIIWFFIVYSIVAPFWLLKALINAIRNYESSWTKEIESR
jgi:cellulose synthase/poly-beta-1,6-N-acetylglucosamine synthase-like glycosyltransferase